MKLSRRASQQTERESNGETYKNERVRRELREVSGMD